MANWVILNGELTNTDVPMLQSTASIPLAKSLWTADKNGLHHNMYPQKLYPTASEPFAAALWRTSPTVNDGLPYHELLPGLVHVNLWIEKTEPLIHIYDSNTTDFNTNGNAILQPISCVVRQEKNGRYELSMETDVDAFEKFKYIVGNALLKIPIRRHDEIRQQIFRIYAVNPTMDSRGKYRITVDARHIFYDLNDRILNKCKPNASGKDAIGIIQDNIYGNDVHALKFNGKSDIIKISRSEFDDGTSVTAALIGENNSFVNRWGGELYRDNLYFSINKTIEDGRTSGIIRYSSNMVDIDYHCDYSECITYLIATDNFGNKKIIVNDAIPTKEFPHHIYKSVKFSYEFEDVEQFHEDAQAYFDNYKQPNVNIGVTFADLTDDERYTDFLGLADFEVGDRIIVYHSDLDIIFGNLEIIAKEYDVTGGRTASIEIGTFKNAISRAAFMSGTASTGNQSVADKEIVATQNQLNEVAFSVYVPTPLLTADGDYLMTSDGYYLLYKKE